MGNTRSVSMTRVGPIDEKHDAVSSHNNDKLKELESRVRELENELNASQQRCVDVEARYSQTSDELDMTREQLERVNRQLADSRVQSASERATQQVYSIPIDTYTCIDSIYILIFQYVRRLESNLVTAKQEVLEMVKFILHTLHTINYTYTCICDHFF